MSISRGWPHWNVSRATRSLHGGSNYLFLEPNLAELDRSWADSDIWQDDGQIWTIPNDGAICAPERLLSDTSQSIRAHRRPDAARSGVLRAARASGSRATLKRRQSGARAARHVSGAASKRVEAERSQACAQHLSPELQTTPAPCKACAEARNKLGTDKTRHLRKSRIISPNLCGQTFALTTP